MYTSKYVHDAARVPLANDVGQVQTQNAGMEEAVSTCFFQHGKEYELGLALMAGCRLAEDESRKKERAQRKAQKGLLSFAEEDGAADADESVPEATTSPPVPSTMRSAHDVIDDGRCRHPTLDDRPSKPSPVTAHDGDCIMAKCQTCTCPSGLHAHAALLVQHAARLPPQCVAPACMPAAIRLSPSPCACRLVRERTQAAEALATEEAEVDEERRQKQAAVRQALTRPVSFLGRS